MKRIVLGLVAGVFLFSACKTQSNKYTIKGELTNLNDSILFLGHQIANMPVFDTIHVSKGGEFTYSGETKTPVFAQILTANRQSGFPVILEPGNIKVSGNADSMMDGQIDLSGTPNNTALQDFFNIQKPYMPQMKDLQQKYMEARMSNDSDVMDSVHTVMDSIGQIITDKMKGFISGHPKSIVSAIALQSIMMNMDDSTISSLYSNLDTSVQNGIYGEQIGAKVASTKKTQIGTLAPDFTLKNPEGKDISLSSLRGKYVLIDFWASWCGPCRAENPNVVATFNKYKDQDFTILGVSLDKDKSAWTKAISDDHLDWTQVSDLKEWNSTAAQLYGIQAIPANFLLDPTGKIIAKDLRGKALEEELAKVLTQ